MRAIEWEETQDEVRETLTRLEGYIDYIGATDEDRTAYDAAKRDLMFLYTTTENMTRHLRKGSDGATKEI